MPQTDQDKRGVWLRNPEPPIWSSRVSDTTLVINGSGFGNKSDLLLPVVERFTQYADDYLLNDSKWKEYNGKGGAIVKSEFARTPGGKYAYNGWARDQFATSWMQYPQCKKLYASYWTRSINCDTDDYGVLKYSRVTASKLNGNNGGGVYNGVGCFALSNGYPYSTPTTTPFPSFTHPNPANLGSDSGLVYGEGTTAQAILNNAWEQVEYFVNLGDFDQANGGYKCVVVGRSSIDSGAKQMQWTGRIYSLDTFLLGLETANPRKWIKVNGAVTPNTNYSVTLTSSGNTYTVNSGSSPKTAVQIVEELYALLAAVLPTTPGSDGVFMNTAHTEFYLGDPNSGVGHTFSNNLIYDDYGLAVTDLLIQPGSYSRFYLNNNGTSLTGVREPQQAVLWNDGRVILEVFLGNLNTDNLHCWYVNESGIESHRGKVVPRDGGGWEIE